MNRIGWLVLFLLVAHRAWPQEESPPQKHPQEYVLELHKLIQDERYDEAEEYGRELLNSDSLSHLKLTTYAMMNRLYMESEDHQAAVDFFSERIEQSTVSDDLFGLYTMRAEAYRRLGDLDSARWDETLAQEIYAASYEDKDYDAFHSTWRDAFLEINAPQWQLCLLATAAVWCIAVGLNILIGNRQRREGRGTRMRLFGVSVLLAIMQTGPVIAVCLMHLSTPEDWYIDNAFQMAALTTLAAMFIVAQSVRPPARWNVSQDVLPEVEEEQVLVNIATSAQRLGIATPVVRRIPSLGDLALQAYAGGLPAPSVAAGDGVLLRLSDEECKAIMGHELGHIANKSLWFYPLVAAVSCTLMVLATLHFTFWVACVWGLAFYAGLIKIVSRYFEFDCDRKAALVAGHQVAITAIDKIHITSPVDNEGWMSFLAFSMATHPSHEERLNAIAHNAPPDEEISVTWSKPVAQRRHWGSIVALILWLVIVFVTPFLPVAVTGELILGIVYMGVWGIPSLLLNAALRKSVMADAKRATVQLKTNKLSTWILILSVVLFLIAIEMKMIEREHHIIWNILPNSIVLLSVAMFLFAIYLCFVYTQVLVRGPSTNLAAKVAHDMHMHRWQEAIDRAASKQHEYKNDLGIQHNIALCHWKLDEQERALEILAKLRREQPKYHQPWLTEATLRLERDEIDKALELSGELIEKSPEDYGPYSIAAICYRLQGNYEAVAEMLTQIEKYSTHNAFIPSSRGMVAMDQGDADAAREYFLEADRLAPSDPGILLAQAEWEIRFGSQEQGETLLNRARKLLDASPFSMLSWRIRTVEQLLSERVTGA